MIHVQITLRKLSHLGWQCSNKQIVRRSTSSSSTAPRFDLRQPHGKSQPSVAPVPRTQHNSDIYKCPTHGTLRHKWRQKTPTQTIVINSLTKESVIKSLLQWMRRVLSNSCSSYIVTKTVQTINVARGCLSGVKGGPLLLKTLHTKSTACRWVELNLS